MEPEPIDQVERTIDQRVSSVEQILLTLPTKQEMADVVAPLATRAELREATAPLATKGELRGAVAPLATSAEMREEGKRTRQHFDVVAESLRSDIKLLAEGITGLREQHERRLEKVEQDVTGLDHRVLTLEAGRRRRTR